METLQNTDLKSIINNSLNKAISYQDYRTLVKELVAKESTTGAEKTEALANYTMLNDRRMKRWDKTVKVTEAIKEDVSALKVNQTWLVLTESWCGDAAQTLPVINKVATVSNNIDLKIVLRDENEELINLFLTNGSKSIPKLIALDTHKNVLNSWGPRPSKATKMVKEYKEKHGTLDADFKRDLQIWYNKDKGKNTQKDLLKLL